MGIFKKIDSSREKTKTTLKLVGFGSFSLFVLFSFIVNKGLFLYIDRLVNSILEINKGSYLFFYSKVLEYLYIFLMILCLRMLFKFYKKGEKLEALLLTITGFMSLFAQFFVKPIFNILCPGSYYNSVAHTYSLVASNPFFQRVAANETCYPSNHTVGYIVVCGYLALLLKRYFPKKRETNFLAYGLIFIMMTVGLTRVYLHVHWLSDVIAAYFLGGAFLALIFWTRLHRREFRSFLKETYEKLEKIKK